MLLISKENQLAFSQLVFCVNFNFRLREKGAVSLELMVWSFNKEAINFYESIGMAEKNKVMEYKL
nr:hypothetical protein [Clostridium paraputrificum]